MCGIAGVVSFNQQKVEKHILKNMGDVIRHRGPDAEGQWVNESENIGLAHRRLSILDLSEKGAQPMHFADKYTITFNGEIYNYLEVKDLLTKANYTFNSGTDTEVILAAYDKWGVDCLKYFDGMFAFALWDASKQQLFCARDRFGEKPFFFNYQQNRHFVFGSEQKCLFAYGIEKRINNRMLFNYLAYDVVQNSLDKSETFYQNIQSLEAAHYLLVSPDGTLQKKRYWHLDVPQNSNITFEQACERFSELLFTAVERRLRSDVPVGSSLSGGLDSSSIVLIIHNLSKGKNQIQKTFSARFEKPFDEGDYMQKVTDRPGIDPHYTWPSADTMLSELDKLYVHQEEPFGSASILAQWEVMKLATENGITVLLDGQGADEIMAGYLKYFKSYFTELYLRGNAAFHNQLSHYQEVFGKPYQAGLRFKMESTMPKLLRGLGSIGRAFTTPAYFTGLSKDFINQFRGDPAPFSAFNTLNETLKYDTLTYGLEKLLRFSDRNAMAFSREVRLPYLSHELVEFLFSLPAEYKIHNGWTKAILRHSMKEILPQEITWRKDKLGFQPPQRNWMKEKNTQELIMHYQSLLENEHILQKESNIDSWKVLMAGKLFEHAKSNASV